MEDNNLVNFDLKVDKSTSLKNIKKRIIKSKKL